MKRLLACAAVGLFAAGCTPNEPPIAAPGDKSANQTDQQESTAKDVNRKVDAAAEAIARYGSEQKDRLVEEFNEKLTKLDEKVAKLKARAERATEPNQTKLKTMLGDLRRKRDAAAEKLDKLKTSSEEAWDDAKRGLEKAWSDLEAAYGDAAAHFDSDESGGE